MSAPPCEPGPGPLTTQGPVSSVYLIKDRVFAVFVGLRERNDPIETTRFTSIHLNEELLPEGSGLSKLVASLSDYVKQLKAEKDGKALFTLKIREDLARENLQFMLVFAAPFIEKLREILLSPSLHVRGAALHSERERQFEKVIELKEGMKLNRLISEWISNDVVIESGSLRSLALKLSIGISWQSRPESPPIKLNSDSFLENLFLDESSKDFTVVAGNGAEVKCHKLIFSAHSPVLAAMVSSQNGMREGQTSRVEMGENSEEGVKNLIRYLYCIELDTTDMTCEVAVELLKTAHQYQLTGLESSLRDMLGRRAKEWYQPDVVMELYYYARNVEDLKGLADDALRIMTRMQEEIRYCERFQELNKEEALELLWKLVDVAGKEAVVAAEKMYST